MFGRRPDATLVRDLSSLRRFMPYISPRMNDSLFLFSQDVEVENAIAFVEERNRNRPENRPLHVFHVVLTALARMLDERPEVNRFVSGGRIWQRDGVWITFSAKMKMEESAPMITVKRRIDTSIPIETTVDAIYDSLERGRRGEKTQSDKEVDWLLILPPSVVRLAMRFVDWIDDKGLLPRSMIDPDPMFASAFIANLGSVGLDAGWHHLWEHGNCPIFGVIGQIQPGPNGRRKVTLKWTYDERIADGLYAMGSLALVKELIESPEKLSG